MHQLYLKIIYYKGKTSHGGCKSYFRNLHSESVEPSVALRFFVEWTKQWQQTARGDIHYIGEDKTTHSTP